MRSDEGENRHIGPGTDQCLVSFRISLNNSLFLILFHLLPRLLRKMALSKPVARTKGRDPTEVSMYIVNVHRRLYIASVAALSFIAKCGYLKVTP